MFTITEFTPDLLFDALANEHCSRRVVSENRVVRYLERYLAHQGSSTILIEEDYVDADYLDDVSAFYVKCFVPYGSKCKRVHFFRGELLTRDSFLAILLAPNGDEVLTDSYLGFVVARPLPQAVVGRTVLKTYDLDGGRRHYLAVRSYTANLFGLSLEVPSLAFQQQDRALAACATVALWSAFHKTAKLFNTPAPSPATITRSAGRVITSRPLPSKGLEIHQICDAIRDVGLEPEVYRPALGLPVASLIYSYLQLGQPVVLGIEIEGAGLHAITITGYSMTAVRGLMHEAGFGAAVSIPSIGERIEEFYAHDDQVGPFSRIKVNDPQAAGDFLYFTGSWEHNGAPAKMTIRVIVIPTYNKIRLGYADIYSWVTKLNQFLIYIGLVEPEWEIYLNSSNAYKTLVRSFPETSLPSKQTVLLEAHPKYMWCAKLREKGGVVFEMLFDATDIYGSLPAYEIRWDSLQHRATLGALLRGIDQATSRAILGERLLLFLLRCTTD